MKLDVLDLQQLQEVRKWRNAEPQFLRTSYMLTEEMQEDFFNNVISDRDSKHRYFAIVNPAIEPQIEQSVRKYGKGYVLPEDFIGMGGLTNIEWENGCAEISLIINPEYRGKGYGIKAVDLILNEAFYSMRLCSVYGEVYDCGNTIFWKKTFEKHEHYYVKLKDRKHWHSQLWDSMWFSYRNPTR